MVDICNDRPLRQAGPFFVLCPVLGSPPHLRLHHHFRLVPMLSPMAPCDEGVERPGMADNQAWRRGCTCIVFTVFGTLTFRNRASYIYRTGTPLPSKHPILYFFRQIYVLIFFKYAAHSPFFFFSNCRLFHNATFFGSCIIHILHTGCAKI